MVLILQFISDKSDSVKEALRILKKSGKKKVCYVTLNKSCGALREIFEKEKLGSDRFFYVDGISSVIGSPSSVVGCSYVKIPYKLKPIAKEIKKAIAAGSSVVVFDSLSSLLSYGQSVPAGLNIVIDFIKSFSEELGKNNGDAIFLCKKSDAGNLLIEETVPIFDKVVGGEK